MAAGYDDLDNVPTQTPGSSPVLASDWNTYVRDNFSQIRFGHVVVPSMSNLPSATTEGIMAYVSNDNKIVMSNGSTWCDIFDLDNVATVASVPTLRSVPVGVINQYVGATAPDGWLFCDGGAGTGAGTGTLNASAGSVYADLWGVLNSAGFSGIGSQSAMTLPDLRGRVPVGKGTNGDVDVLGDNEGIAAVDVANRRPKHYHNISGTATSGGVDHTHGYYQQPGYTAASSAGSGIPRAADNNAASGGYPTNTGGASAYLHTHPLSGTAGPTSSSPIDGPAFITVNYIIKF